MPPFADNRYSYKYAAARGTDAGRPTRAPLHFQGRFELTLDGQEALLADAAVNTCASQAYGSAV